MNALLSRLVGRSWNGADANLPDDDLLAAAAATLAGRAHDLIGAGWTAHEASAAVRTRAGQQVADDLADDLGDAAREAMAFERAAILGVLARLDDDVIMIGGEEWTSDLIEDPVLRDDGSRPVPLLLLESPSGGRRTVEVEVYLRAPRAGHR